MRKTSQRSASETGSRQYRSRKTKSTNNEDAAHYSVNRYNSKAKWSETNLTKLYILRVNCSIIIYYFILKNCILVFILYFNL